MEQEQDAVIEIPNCSVHAEGMEMSVEEFVKYVEGIGKKYPSLTFEGYEISTPSYSEEYDTMVAFGVEDELESFARELDEEMLGGAQSTSAEDSFVNCIEPL